MIFLYRLLPVLVSVTVGLAFYFQLENPIFYPWLALLSVALAVASAFAMAIKRVRIADMLEKMLPSLLLLLALVFGMLMAEGVYASWLIVMFASVATFLSLELLFLLAFMPSRYPVNGLSHVNIAYVPFIIWYAASNSVGLMSFLHSPKWIHVIGMTLLSIVLFRTTGHPGATTEQNRTWSLVGGLTGLHIGLLGIALPLSMSAQATLAMLLFSAVLRLRRYLYHPLPSRKQAWIEGVAVFIIMCVAMGTARWL